MDWFYEIKEGFIVPRTGFEPVTYGLEIDCMLDKKLKCYSISNHTNNHLHIYYRKRLAD